MNELSNFLNSIKFKYMTPSIPLDQIQSYLQKYNMDRFQFEIENLEIDNKSKYIELLSVIQHVPKMSTFALGSIINKCVSLMKPNSTYVNVGVWNGYSLLAGMIGNEDKLCIGIDNFSQFGGPIDEFTSVFNIHKSNNHFFFNQDYKEYFENHSDPIGFYFYDGNHSSEDQYDSLCIAEKFYDSDCIIMVDDINMAHVYYSTMQFINERSNKYKILYDVRNDGNGHPTYWDGLLIFQKII